MPPKRRDRRGGAAPNSGQSAAAPSPTTATNFPLLAAISIVAVAVVAALLAVFRPFSGGPTPSPVESLSAQFRGLVKSDVSFREILTEHSRVVGNRTRRHFMNPVLGYVTPWNSKGYEMAKQFSHQLTHISPVWYELKSEGNVLVMEGRHNADIYWISELRRIGHSLVLPRVVLEVHPSELLQKKEQRTRVIDAIVKECKDMGYDGIVLESWSRWAAYGVLPDPDLRKTALEFIKELGQALHSTSSVTNSSHHLELIYVIPAPRSQKLGVYDFGPLDMQQVTDFVDGFSLMTYDFSGPQSPGPNAPLSWIQSSLNMLLADDSVSGALKQANKIFLGLNFYGNDFVLSEGSNGGGAITGGNLIALLEKHKPALRWDEKSAEHYFVYTRKNVKHAVFYPSLLSLHLRIEEARNWGAALSIWELGQGLDYFFDLL